MTIFRKTVLSAEKKCIFIGRGYCYVFPFTFALYYSIRRAYLGICAFLAILQNVGQVRHLINNEKNEWGVYGVRV
ncbi:MAG: hypothetical protein LBC64_01910 [Fibromonadaceae bacterium]|jgi:hypothetical protein|nr:hypothetical protein [Fibromonadaceae bacterium]